MNIDNVQFYKLHRSALDQTLQDPLLEPLSAKITPLDSILREKPLKITFAQQRLWALEQAHPAANLANHRTILLSLEGELNSSVLRGGLELLVKRHEMLRSQFRLYNGEPHQFIMPFESNCIDFAEIDLSQHLFKAQVLQLDELLKGESNKRLDLMTGPLFRVRLIKRSTQNTLLLLTFHQILADTASIALFIKEWVSLYSLLLTQGSHTLTNLKLQYADYANWQQQPETIQQLKQSLSYWQQQLQGAPEQISLPSKVPRSNDPSYQTAQYSFKFANIILKQLQPSRQQPQITLFMKLAALWGILLTRLNGQDEVVLGIPVINRLHPELHTVIGYFENSLPLRVKLGECHSFNDVLQQVHQHLQAAYSHQMLPFEVLLESLDLESDGTIHPLYQVELSLNHNSLTLPQLPALKIAQVDKPYSRALLDLKLSFTENSQGLSAEIEYSTDLFERQSIKQMVGYFKQLLRAMITDAEQPFRAVPLLSSSEQQQILEQFNATAQPDLPLDLLHRLFEQQAAAQPEAIALEFANEQWSYARLNRHANRLAQQLITQGVKPDTRVAICVECGPAMLVGLLASLKAGGTYVPLDPSYPVARLNYMLEDANPLVLITQQHLSQQFDYPLVRLLIDPYLSEDSTQKDNPNPWVEGLTPSSPACIIYTSGEIEQSKGVRVTHRAICNLVIAQQSLWQLTPRSRVLQFASFSFDACIWECAMALLTGATLVLAKRDALIPGQALGETLTQQQISHVLLPSVAARALPHHFTLPQLQTLAVWGERCSIALVQRFAVGRRLLNIYGPTECSGCATVYCCDLQDKRAPAIGRPIANTQIYILDPQGQLVPTGVTGEIYIGGVGVASGYLGHTALSAERFIANPFSEDSNAKLYRTGDLGCWRADGCIEYRGNNDFQVKIAGRHIDLAEIETHLLRCDGVQDALVIASQSQRGEQRLLAYVIPESKMHALSTASLRHCLAQHLAKPMIPSDFVLLEQFPLTANGTLDRSALPAPDSSAVARGDNDAPQGLAEQHLVEIWQGLLGLDQVGRYDNFFELGGHSMLIVSLIEQLRQRHWSISAKQVLATPQLSEMAQAMQLLQLSATQPIAIPANLIAPDAKRITPEMLTLVNLTQREIDQIATQVIGGTSNIQDIYPLAPLQQGIFFHYLYHPIGDPYLLQCLLGFESQAALLKFAEALQQVINRHDVLRTAICWEGLEQPLQVVWRQAKLMVQYHHFSQNNDVAKQLLAQSDPTEYRLNLKQAPLMILDVAEDKMAARWLVNFGFHHLVADHLSLELMFHEVALILADQSAQFCPVLPYRNFIAQVLAQSSQPQLEFFQQQLSGVSEPTACFGLLATPSNSAVLNEAHTVLNTQLVARLRRAAQQMEVSCCVLFHVAWSMVVAQSSGRDDVLFGTVMLGRMQGMPSLAKSLGVFINTLPIRVKLDEQTVQQLIQAIALSLTCLMEHAQTPLAFAQRCSAIVPPLPMFSTLLNYRESQSDAEPAIGLDAEVITTNQRIVYPIVVSVDHCGESLSLKVQSCAEISPSMIIDYLMQALDSMLNALEQSSVAAALSLTILPDRVRHTIVEEFNATTEAIPTQRLIHQQFELWVQRTPQAIAAVYETEQLTYLELNQRANHLAQHLIACGARVEQPIALCLARGLDQLVGFLAILKSGAAYLPLDPNYPAQRLAYILQDAQPTLLITEQAFAARFSQQTLILIDQFNASRELSSNLIETAAIPVLANSHALAYIIYTSGSSGQPKGVMLEHDGLCNLVLTQQTALGLNPQSRVLQFASNSFDAAIWEYGMALLSGATLYLAPLERLTPSAPLVALLQQHQISHLLLSPTLLSQMEELPHCVTTLLVGGEVCSATLCQRWAEGRRMFNAYGPTETTICAALSACDSESDRTPPIGSPISNTKIYILDKQQQPVPFGVVGEIYIGGMGVARGYLNQAALNDRCFLHNPFDTSPGACLYRTGDFGRWLSNGKIEYVGRQDTQVKVRGIRIELTEIEQVLMALPAIRTAIVVAMGASATTDRQLVAYITLYEDHAVSLGQLRQALAARLPEYMLPSAFVLLEQIPLTANSKLDRSALLHPETHSLISHCYVAPEGPLEQHLAALWQKLLGVQRIGRHDHFFELGGHSLMAMQLSAQLRKEGIELPLATLFSAPTLRQMATMLRKSESHRPRQQQPILLRRATCSGDLGKKLFLVHDLYASPMIYTELALKLDPSIEVYGLHALGLEQHLTAPSTLEQLAALHIATMQRVAPNGPYYLAGWSLGGVLAYEIAKQLREQAEKVELVAMIDSYHPSVLKSEPTQLRTRHQIEQQLLQDYLLQNSQISAAIDLETLQQQSSMSQLLAYSMTQTWWPAHWCCSEIQAIIQSAAYLWQLAQRYQPVATLQQVQFYSAPPQGKPDTWHGWRDSVAVESQHYTIEANHQSILHGAALNQIAVQLDISLLSESNNARLHNLSLVEQPSKELLYMDGSTVNRSSLFD